MESCDPAARLRSSSRGRKAGHGARRAAMTRMQRLVRWLPARTSPSRQAAITAGCVLAGAVLRFALEPLIGGTAPFLTFFPAVIVAGIWAGTAAGAATLAIGAAIAAWAWLEPARAAALTGSGAASLVAFLSAGTIILVCIHLLRTAAEMTERARAEAALIAQETQHRVGNVLALVQAVARLSARHAASLREFEERFHDRLRALADAQAAAGGTSDLPGDLSAMFRAVLRPFQERIAMDGPATRVAESDRAMLALLIHELGTNAVKHGALSAPE